MCKFHRKIAERRKEVQIPLVNKMFLKYIDSIKIEFFGKVRMADMSKDRRIRRSE